MIKTSVRPLLLLLAIFFNACNNEEPFSKEEFIPIDLNSAKTKAPLSTLLSNPQFILLKDKTEIPLASPYQFQFKNRKLFVRDLDFNNIHIYSDDGNFLGGIFSSGEGPEEFNQINDFFVTEDQIVIQDTFLRKILVFDHQGNFLSERKHLINNSRLAFSKGKFLYYMANDPEFDGMNFLIEKNGIITSKFHPIEPDLAYSGKFLQSNSFIPLGDDRYLFYRAYTYQLNYLDISREKLEKSITFDFGDAQLTATQHQLNSNAKNQLIAERNMVSQFISVLPTSNGTMISFLRGNQDRYYLYLGLDRKSTQLFLDPENDFFPIKLNSPWTTDGNRIYFVLSSFDFFTQYSEAFSGKKVSIIDGNIHDFFRRKKDLLREDYRILISFQIKDDILTKE